jgi:hypothetical protein
VRGAVAERGVAPVEVEVGIKVVGHLQPGLFEAGECAAVRQQLGFERALARLGLGIIVGIARSAKTGQCLGLFDARPAS